MSIAPTATTETGKASTTAAKVAAAAPILFGVAMFWTVASVHVPHHASDAKLLELVAGAEQPNLDDHLGSLRRSATCRTARRTDEPRCCTWTPLSVADVAGVRATPWQLRSPPPC